MPALIAALVLLTWFYRATIYSSFDDQLDSAVTALIASVETVNEGQLILRREPLDPRYQRALSGRYWIIGQADAENDIQPLLASRSLIGGTLSINSEDQVRLRGSPGEAIRFSTAGPNEDEPLRVIARQVVLPGWQTPVIAMAAADRRPVTRAIQQSAIASLIILGVLTAGLLAAIYAQVRLGLRPLFALADRVADVREGRASNVTGRYPSEIAGVAEELNSLISHNRNVVERAQTHVGNLAHALKTPVAVLRNEAGLGNKVDADVVLRQTETMSSQVDHHLRRARAAARGQAIGLSCEVDTVLSALSRTLPRLYRDKDLIIDVDGEAGLRFRGDQRDLEDMVGNLMDNAAKWTHSQIDVSRDVHNMSLRITVEDNGPGIPDNEVETALKRGARLDEATPGSGLGLSIVNDLAEAYGGSLILTRSMLGGLKAQLHLPRAQDHAR